LGGCAAHGCHLPAVSLRRGVLGRDPSRAGSPPVGAPVASRRRWLRARRRGRVLSTGPARPLPAARPGPRSAGRAGVPGPPGAHPHDVAPAVDGGVWFTAQAAGYLGWLDPTTGEIRQIALGPRSAPHGVIVGPDGAPWVTDGGQNAIVRVDPQTSEVRLFPLSGRNANLNTATFDRNGNLWFTGQNGVYGRVNPSTGEVTQFDAPRGPGPYGITATPDGSRVFYAS